MSNQVIRALARKYRKVKKGVGRIMAGEILEYEAKTILNQGRTEGRREGRMEGRRDEIFESVLEGDYGVKRGAQKLNVSVSQFEKMMDEYLKNM